jgi:hypothetical protein
MSNAKHDQNGIPVLLGALSTDGITPVPIQVTASINALNVSNGTSGSDNGTTNAQRDQNRIPVLIAVSAADGVTPVEIYADSLGNLLVRST